MSLRLPGGDFDELDPRVSAPVRLWPAPPPVALPPATPAPLPRNTPTRPRRPNPSRALTPEDRQAQAAAALSQSGGAPWSLPWQPHPSLVAPQERLPLLRVLSPIGSTARLANGNVGGSSSATPN